MVKSGGNFFYTYAMLEQILPPKIWKRQLMLFKNMVNIRENGVYN